LLMPERLHQVHYVCRKSATAIGHSAESALL
jgi:hypothetical protein